MQKNTGKFNHLQADSFQNVSASFDTQTPQSKKTYKSRSKYECPPGLKDLIRAANLLPKTFHFDLIEAAQEKLKEYEQRFPKRNRESIDFSSDDVDTVLRKANQFLQESQALENLYEWAYDHRFNWFEFFRTLPEVVKKYLMQSKEVEQFYKTDSYEYWENNEDYANERLEELYDCEEITEEEYHTALENDVASLLVEKGYYGEQWSYHDQKMEDRDNLSYRDNENRKRDFYSTINFAHYAAYLRLEETRDFIYGLVDLQRKINEEKHYHLNLSNHLPKKLAEDIRATNIKINERGEIHFSISEWAEIIQGVDISRIRRCEVCDQIFWANRKDAFACSKGHAKTRQMRLLRQNWKETGDLYLKARKKKLKEDKK